MEGPVLGTGNVELRSVWLKPLEKRTLHQEEGLLFLFATHGAGEWRIGTWRKKLDTGDVLIVNPVSRGRLYSNGPAALSLGCFFVAIEQLGVLCNSTQLCLLQGLLERLKAPNWYPASSPLAQTCHQLLSTAPPEGTPEHRSHLLRIVALLLSAQFRDAPAGTSQFLGSDEHFLQILEQFSIAELITTPVQELAARFGCSRRQLNRLLHRHFGRSACALKIEMRLLRAALLLRNPANKVVNVAEQCGFNHLGLFNTCFKRRFGVCPTTWRQQDTNRSGSLTGSFQGHPDCQVRARGLCAWSGRAHRNGQANGALSMDMDRLPQ